MAKIRFARAQRHGQKENEHRKIAARQFMPHRFKKHYTRAEASALLPQIRLWLKRIVQLREDLEKYENRLNSLMQPGCDLGGETVNSWVRLLADIQEVFMEFHQREIQIKDLA